ARGGGISAERHQYRQPVAAFVQQRHQQCLGASEIVVQMSQQGGNCLGCCRVCVQQLQRSASGLLQDGVDVRAQFRSRTEVGGEGQARGQVTGEAVYRAQPQPLRIVEQ